MIEKIVVKKEKIVEVRSGSKVDEERKLLKG